MPQALVKSDIDSAGSPFKPPRTAITGRAHAFNSRKPVSGRIAVKNCKKAVTNLAESSSVGLGQQVTLSCSSKPLPVLPLAVPSPPARPHAVRLAQRVDQSQDHQCHHRSQRKAEARVRLWQLPDDASLSECHGLSHVRYARPTNSWAHSSKVRERTAGFCASGSWPLPTRASGLGAAPLASPRVTHSIQPQPIKPHS